MAWKAPCLEARTLFRLQQRYPSGQLRVPALARCLNLCQNSLMELAADEMCLDRLSFFLHWSSLRVCGDSHGTTFVFRFTRFVFF